MQITIEIEDSYANGDEFIRTEAVTVTPPLEGADIDDWGVDALHEFTGQNGDYSGMESRHDVKVLDCVERPDLVGQTFSFG